MREELASAMGFTEVYAEGEDLGEIIDTGDPYPEPEEYFDFNDEPYDWDVDFESERFKKLHGDEITLYLYLDEDGEPICGIIQFP